MGDAKSPDLPTPGQAVAIAEKIVAGAKKPPDLPTPDQAIDVAKMHFKKSKERSSKQIVMDQELDPSGPFSDITEETDAYLRQRTRENIPVKEYVAPKYVPTEKQCRTFLRRFYAHRITVGEKMEVDGKVKKTVSSKPTPLSALEVVKERAIEDEDGEVTFTLDFGGEDDGKLHITYDLTFTSEYGEPGQMRVEDISVDKKGLSISRLNPDGQEEEHFISRYNPRDNEVNENTPQAIQRAEELINLYLRS